MFNLHGLIFLKKEEQHHFLPLTIKLCHFGAEGQLANNSLDIRLVDYCTKPSVDVLERFAKFRIQHLQMTHTPIYI